MRGVGLIGAIELMADKATRTPFAAERKAGYRLAQLAQEEGLIVRAMGDSIGLCPPLIITPAELDDLFARLGRAMARFQSELSQ
ncbi:Adenosylmethionine-8-amino-7-oxononanoate aminotransferase [compost metagenome]